ncbi:MAG TPA: hypothetical protein VN796_01115 [Acidimicrobiales bacterium]|nr:hypothetical protein [Acidimicrobiales bacterium]
MTVVVTMALLSVGGTASARTTKGAAGTKCAKHAQAKRCQQAGGGGTPGPGGDAAQIQVTVSPNPVVETGTSEIHAVVEVETLQSFAGDEVTISSQQLLNSCAPGTVQFVTNSRGAGPEFFSDAISVAIDADGNATVALYAVDCAPGTDLIEADLATAPYLTATSVLTVLPPAVTPEGLTGVPNDEVETGNTSGVSNPSGDSDVYAVFYVETDPAYAEEMAEISSPELESRCGEGWWWQGGNDGSVVSEPTGVVSLPGPVSLLDNDGNAVFVFFGASCAPGDSTVIADVEAGNHPTYSSVYTILAPTVTI